MQNKKTAQVKHPGLVERVEGKTVLVRIESQAACGQCQAKSHCGMAESAEKLIEVTHPNPGQFTIGDPVIVSLEQSLGYKALMLGYIIPFLILLIALFILTLTTGNEGLAALVAVLLMGPYYGVLYNYRHRLKKIFHFRIHQD